MECKAFVNYAHNGVYLKFPNGNGISTIWGRGASCENHNFTTGEGSLKDYTTLIEEGSNQAEIMIDTLDDKLRNKIFRKLDTSPDNEVIGWVDMERWLWVIKQLSKAHNIKEA